MKKILMIIMALLCMFTFVGCGDNSKPEEITVVKKYSDPAVRAAARADQMAKSLIEKYIDEKAYNLSKEDALWETFLYEEYDPITKKPEGNASVWHYTSVIAMTNRLATINDGNKTSKDYYLGYNANLIEELSWYRGTSDITTYQGTKEITMYGVNRATKRGEAAIAGTAAVLDDQMWLIREMIAAYGNTGNKEYLKEAEVLTAACLFGWDTTEINGVEHGGIPWGAGYTSFHSCSNGPIIAPLAKLAELYKDSNEKIGDVKKYDYYLGWAKKVYEFTYSKLKNYDNTYADAFWTDRELVARPAAEGGNYYKTTKVNNIDNKAYTYNVGAMISGGAELYRITNEKRYLDEARSAAQAADSRFATMTSAGIYNLPSSSTVWFNLVLLTGYMELYPHAKAEVAPYIEKYEKALDFAYENYYLNGFLPRNYVDGWVFGSRSFDSNIDIMDTAANAEMYAMLSQFHKSIK